MARIRVYNLQGAAGAEIELSDKVFGVKPNVVLIHQVYEAMRANARQPWADTKNRGEVRGGGKKPWPQKGTGRARHGSIRSPIWKGGGVAFGPLSTRNYEQKINKKMSQQAVRMCLSGKLNDGQFVVLETMPTDGKTKTLAGVRQQLPGQGKTTLIVTDKVNATVMRAVRNIPKVAIARAEDLNVMDLLQYQFVVTTPEAVSVLEKRLA